MKILMKVFLYTIYNIIDNENKFLLITSEKEINKMKINLLILNLD